MCCKHSRVETKTGHGSSVDSVTTVRLRGTWLDPWLSKLLKMILAAPELALRFTV